jgi:hypothetical protein
MIHCAEWRTQHKISGGIQMQFSRDVAHRFKGAINSLWTVSGSSSTDSRSAQGWSLVRSAAAVLCFVVLMFATQANAQTAGAGSIQGVVTDPTGAVVPNAVVTLTEQSTQVTLTTKSSSGGDYAFPNINVGNYSLTVTAEGFDTYIASGNILEVGSSISLNAKMTVGSKDVKVEVHADGVALQTEDSTFKQTVDKTELTEMPLNGRHMTDLITLAGGASPSSVQDATGSKFPNQSTTISIAGASGNMLSYRLDGGDNQDHMGGGNYPLPFPDAVGQFSLETAALGAQDGVHIGGLVNVVTQSGTNRFHGSAFEFIRNNYFDGTNFFVQPCVNGARPPSCGKDTLHQNEYGGTFGGPVWIPKLYDGRDKLFFFAGYQHHEAKSVSSTSNAYLPTAANLAGDFSGTDPVPLNPLPAGQKQPTTLCGQAAVQLYDPLTGVAIPGNNYNNLGAPTFQQNASALKLLPYLPYQNATTHQLPALADGTDVCGHVQFAIPNQNFDTEFITRFDYTINKSNNLYVRYWFDSYQLPAYYSPTNILLTANNGNPEERFQSLTIGENYVINASVVNSIHVTGLRQLNNRGYNANDINATALGINVYQLEPVGLQIGSSANIHGFTIGGGSNSLASLNDTTPIDISDDVTWIHGKHQISFGGAFVRNQLNINNAYNGNGVFSFNGKISGSPLGASTTVGDSNLDLLEGAMNSFTQSKPQQNALRGSIPTLYVQDTFHATTSLTLTAGVRWLPLFMPHDYFHRGTTFNMAAFLANQHSSVYSNAPAGSFFYGDPGVQPALTSNSPYNFNPNFAFAYNVSGNGKTVIRGGVEYAYDEPNFFIQQRVQQNPPFGTQIAPSVAGQICFSEPWLVGTSGNGCNQVNGVNTSPFPQPTVPSPANATFLPQSQYIVLQSHYQMPDTLQWTASIQHQFPRGWSAQIFYTGNRTQHMVMGLPLSQAVFVPGAWGANATGCGNSATTGFTPGGVVTTGPAAIAAKTTAPVAGSPCSTTNNYQARYYLTTVSANPTIQTQGNLYSGGGGGSLTEATTGYANYNGMIATLQHRFSSSFSLLTNYTYSKCLNNSDPQGDISGTQLENPSNPALDYGRCGSDQRNIFNTGLVAKSAFPVHGVTGYLLNNWEIAPQLNIVSGFPINITAGSDYSLTNIGNDRPNQIAGVSPFRRVTIQRTTSAATSSYLNPAAFAEVNAPCPTTPAPNAANCPYYGTYGNVGRNSLNGPMQFNLNAQISRIFPIEGKVSLDTRIEAFNALNHPNFSNANGNVSSGQFGFITGTSNGARVFQGAVKLSF